MPVHRIKQDKNTGGWNVVYQGGGEHASGPHAEKEHARSIAKRLNQVHKEMSAIGNEYGSGHDMTKHGEGKPYGEK